MKPENIARNGQNNRTIKQIEEKHEITGNHQKSPSKQESLVGIK